MNERPAPLQRVVLVTGLSGAGKGSILRLLEDMGYEAVDNPPLTMIEELVARSDPRATVRLAVGVDARSRGFDPEAVLATLDRLRGNPALRAELVYAWAEETVLLRRFTETRRRHPLAPEGRVLEGIAREQAATGLLHEAADMVLDTSGLSLPALRQTIESRFGPDSDASATGVPRGGLNVTLLSFAFPAGLPREADMVFDARFLRNPHYVSDLKPKTGLDPEVGAYVEADPDFPGFFTRVADLLELLLPRFVQEGKKYASIAVGCSGGRHRSVHIIERLAVKLCELGWRVSVNHRELGREATLAPTGSAADNLSRAAPETPARRQSVQAQEA